MRNAVIFLIIALLISLGVNTCQWRKAHNDVAHGTDTIRITDTITIVEPVVVESLVVRTVERKMQIVDTVQILKRDTLVDSIMVYVPITQKMYQDSNYIAWVSGYEPRLDSIRVYRHETIIRERMRRWNIGVQAGYGVTTKGLSPYIGLGINLRLY